MPRSKRPSEYLPAGTYEALLEAQGGSCGVHGGQGGGFTFQDGVLVESYVCDAVPGSRRFAIDHNHKTGTVRGLLCHKHNRRLWAGATPQELRAMADYLERAGE